MISEYGSGPGLPGQVQNIASMTAGVNCADMTNTYTALEFDISLNMFGDETLMVRRPRELKRYRLSDAEKGFIEQVSRGETPEDVQHFFERYIELSDNRDANMYNVPFMADYRVWYTVYCANHIIREGHSFIEKAGLDKEDGNPQKLKDARACYLVLQQLYKLLEQDHRLIEIRKSFVTELIKPLQNGLMQVMLEDMNSDNAQRFLLFRNELIDYYKRYLYFAPEEQLQGTFT